MLQETTIAPGGDAAAALSQMGVDHLINEMVTNPGQHIVQWVVALTLILMSVMSIYWIVVNLLKNMNLRRRGDSVVATFWETTNAQDAIRYMEEQPRSEPFSKIALDAAQAAAHHQQSRSEEHTSELQSLMPISYAVFCLKKKK